MTSTVTTSFNPPPTQNTAPIIEHRCLYTQDLRRKAKRWQDGVLRFHTFNKRVMVYDVPRNFIGDTHWREDYPVQDGDEFQLDRPVLVQVGEQVGSVDQDLTELFEKRHNKKAMLEKPPALHSSSPPLSLDSSGPRISSVGTAQIAPKSLSAVLGTSKGIIGRAKLPTKTPFELRTNNDVIQRGLEPQAKRRRIEGGTDSAHRAINCRDISKRPSNALGKENRQAVENINGSVMGRTPQSRERPRSFQASNKKPPSLKSRATTIIPQDVEVVTSRRDLREQSVQEDRKEEDLSIARIGEAISPREGKASKTKKRLSNPAIEPPSPKVLSSSKVYEPPKTINVSSDDDTSTPQSDERIEARVKLRMASRKPRKKLMYKDLLPQDAMVAKSALRRRRVDDSDGNFHVQGGSRLRSDQETRAKRPLEDDSRIRRQHKENRSALTDHGNHRAGKDQESDDAPEAIHEERSPNPPVTEAFDGSRSRSVEISEPNIPKATPTIHDTNTALAQMDEILLSNSQLPLATTTKPRSPLQKSNSDMPRSTMTRSASDSGKSGGLGAGSVSVAKEQVMSPWSKEAWDLFGCGRDGEAVDFATFCVKEGV